MLSSNPGPKRRWVSIAAPMIFSVKFKLISAPPRLCGEKSSVISTLDEPPSRCQIAVQPVHTTSTEWGVVVVAHVPALVPPLALPPPGAGRIDDTSRKVFTPHELRPIPLAEYFDRARRTKGTKSQGDNRSGESTGHRLIWVEGGEAI